jgi:hypothetical protein
MDQAKKVGSKAQRKRAKNATKGPNELAAMNKSHPTPTLRRRVTDLANKNIFSLFSRLRREQK